MGHAGDEVYSEKKSELFPELWDCLDGEWDRHETSDGNIGGIVYSDRIFDSYEEASEYLRKEVRNKYYWSKMGLACRYRKYPDTHSKKFETLKERYTEACRKYNEFSDYVPHLDNKSEFIGCKGCGAKIPTKLHKSNKCPFCGKDLRSETNLNKLQNYLDNYRKLAAELAELQKAEDKKHFDKAKLIWIAYGEVHC